MHSPMKSHPKKTRKSTFNQPSVSQSDVGDFQGGYFVMPDPASSKENDYPVKSKNNQKLERSPARRKQQTNESIALTTSPNRDRSASKFEQDFKKPYAPFIELNKDFSKRDNIKVESPLTPGGFSASTTKFIPSSPKQVQYCDTPSKHNNQYPSKEYLSSSPPTSGRWAGPAFGNAPHPSNLPLPEFPPMMNPHLAPSPHIESYLSSSPPVHDRGPYVALGYPSPSSFHSSSPPSGHLSSIPVIPFPYVGSHVPQVSAPAPSLAQLSTDLRRLLNITASAPSSIVNDPILVSANPS